MILISKYDFSDVKDASLFTSRFSGSLILLEYIKGLNGNSVGICARPSVSAGPILIK